MVKYSHANKVSITCGIAHQEFYLEIKDDGVGIANLDTNDFEKGAGLRNITIRVKGMGGLFSMQDVKPHGLHSKIVIPLNQVVSSKD